MSGNERSSRCHGHQQKVIASLDEFDMCPLSSTMSPGTSLKFRGFLLLLCALMVFGGGAPPNFARETVLDERVARTVNIEVDLSEHYVKDVDLIRNVASSHQMPID